MRAIDRLSRAGARVDLARAHLLYGGMAATREPPCPRRAVNPEIGTRLFISPRTVQYRLRNVFTKFGISSLNQLDHVLGNDRIANPPS